MLPISNTYQGYTFNRDHILDGTIKVAYGPNQPLNIFSVDQNGIPTAYVNPIDWNKVGTLLRMPQVIRLQGNYPWADITFRDPIGSTDETFTYSYKYNGEPFIDFAGNLVYPPGFIPGIPKPYDIEGTIVWSSKYSHDGYFNGIPGEADRVKALLADVKSKIEALRPGRTWVVITDDDVPGDVSLPANSVSLIPSPDTQYGDFVGTDFLNISISNVTVTNIAPVLASIDEIVQANQDAINNAITLLKGNISKFTNYYSYIYNYDVPLGLTIPLPPYQVIDEGLHGDPPPSQLQYPDPRNNDSGSYVGGVYVPPKVVYIGGDQLVEAYAEVSEALTLANNAIIDATNSAFDNVRTNPLLYASDDKVQNVVDQINSGLGQIVVEFKGDVTNQPLQSDDLVKLIASHYNFDPETGIDIPVE